MIKKVIELDSLKNKSNLIKNLKLTENYQYKQNKYLNDKLTCSFSLRAFSNCLSVKNYHNGIILVQ